MWRGMTFRKYYCLIRKASNGWSTIYPGDVEICWSSVWTAIHWSAGRSRKNFKKPRMMAGVAWKSKWMTAMARMNVTWAAEYLIRHPFAFSWVGGSPIKVTLVKWRGIWMLSRHSPTILTTAKNCTLKLTITLILTKLKMHQYRVFLPLYNPCQIKSTTKRTHYKKSSVDHWHP